VSSLSIVRFHDEFTSITEVKSSGKRYTFSLPKHFTQSYDVTQYLASKKKIYLIFSSDNILEESITLPSIIKNEATLQRVLLSKIHENNSSTEKLVLNKLYTSLDTTEESVVHRYEGLTEKEILSQIAPVPNLEHLRRISVERYALFALAQHAFKGKSYLCVYTEEKKNLIVAVHKDTLLFSRIGFIQSDDETEKIMEQISDIDRTVAYTYQQYREVKFEFIAICGSIANGEIVPMRLNASTGLSITVLAPTLIVNGLEPNMAQNSVLEIGMLFLDKTMNFIPDSVKAAREFYLVSTLTVFFAFLFMLFALYQSHDAYNAYQASLDEYDTVKSTLYRTLSSTDTLDDKQLQNIIAQLKSSTPLHHHLIDDLILFDNVLKLTKPQAVNFTEGGELVLDFKHQCKTLMELYLFEKNFRHEVSTIKGASPIAAYRTNYNTLSFEATLKIGSSALLVDKGNPQ
jgi:hypothetical protein